MPLNNPQLANHMKLYPLATNSSRQTSYDHKSHLRFRKNLKRESPLAHPPRHKIAARTSSAQQATQEALNLSAPPTPKPTAANRLRIRIRQKNPNLSAQVPLAASPQSPAPSPSSLVPQRLDRIEQAGAAGRLEAKKHADRRGKDESHDRRIDRNDDRPFGAARQRVDQHRQPHRRRAAQCKADESTDARQQNRFHEELHEDVAAASADRHANADL